MDGETITRKERRQAERVGKKSDKPQNQSTPRKALFLLVALAVLALVGYQLTKKESPSSSKQETSQVGRSVESQGAGHVTDITEVSYNSNPPTSGSHFPVWLKRGMYEQLVSDGYLIHSLEHGYVIISYDCTKLSPASSMLVKQILAHDSGEPHEEPLKETATESASMQPLTRLKMPADSKVSWYTPENPPEKEVDLPQEFSSGGCKSLVEDLSGLLDKYQRLIIIPRIGMEIPIAVTAWTKIDTMDTLDMDRIERFAKEYHNKGPEKTME